MSYQEFLDWADEDTHAEWVNGKVIMTSPASLMCCFLPTPTATGCVQRILMVHAIW